MTGIARWEIEILFHLLKNGCRIETRQLGTIDRLQRTIALYLIVAWRIAVLMRFGHTCPDLPADLFFHQDEWRAADFLNKQKPPADMPALNEVPRRVAMCGGFPGRKGDGEPGVKTIWLGLPRVMDCAIGLQFARDLVPCELGIRICADSPSGTRSQRLARSMADIEEEVIMCSIRLILN